MCDTWFMFAQAYHEELVKLALAVVLAGILGLEREHKGRTAGLRTHILVCLGATLAMMVSDEIARHWNEQGGPVWLDSGRIAAGILTGVGFLGAGAIITVRGGIQGLTTAAVIWFVATLGLAIGAGHYALSVIATIFAFCVVALFQQVEGMVPAKRRFSCVFRSPGGWERVTALRELFRNEKVRSVVSGIHLSEGASGAIEVRIELNAARRIGVDGLVKACAAWKLPEEDVRIEAE